MSGTTGDDVCDAAFERLRRLALEWRARADERRELDPSDVPAHTLDRCADNLEKEVAALAELLDWLSVEQWASHNDVTPQTVRNWIKKGRLKVFETARGVRIPRTQKVM